MNPDELAFFNEQLAAMLRQGIPLEGALRQLSGGMRRGRLREEIQLLEADLSKGRPLKEAVKDRKLPEVYSRMLIAGAEGGDLPGLLTLAADHFHRSSNLAIRLRGLIVYPGLVLLTSLLLSLLLSGIFSEIRLWSDESLESWGRAGSPGAWFVALWLSPILFVILTAVTLLALSLPQVRSTLRWRIPGFRDASLANLAGTLALLLKTGCRLPEALRLCAELEPSPAVARALREWDAFLAQGERELRPASTASRFFPKTFLWLISSDPEDWIAGFSRAAEIYRRRAQAQAETLLYAAMPVLVLILGVLVLGQATFALQLVYGTLVHQLDALGNV